MAKYRGFVGQVAPLGALRTTYEINSSGYFVRQPVIQVPPTPYIAPEPAPILEPIKTGGYIYDPSQQEITTPQYAEGGDGYATEIERTAKIDEAMERIKIDLPSFSMFHPDDVASSKPIMCMRGNPDVQTIRALVCTPNQAYIDMQKAKGLISTTLPVTAPKPEMPALLPLAIGAGLIWLMS